MAEEPDDLLVADASAWRRWLHGHHASDTAAWVVLTKKGAQAPTTLTYEEAVDDALCYGWIDNKSLRRDATTYRVRFTPRRPGGTWSSSNVRRVERLIASGRMEQAGLKEVEQARADGRWDGAPSAMPPHG